MPWSFPCSVIFSSANSSAVATDHRPPVTVTANQSSIVEVSRLVGYFSSFQDSFVQNKVICKGYSKHRTMIHQTRLSFSKVKNEIPEFKNPSNFPSFRLDRSSIRACHLKDRTKCDTRTAVSHYHRKRPLIHCPPVHCTANGDPQELSDEDEVCPVECVREIKKDKELLAILEKAKKANSLVVVDFYRTSCGSCKYIEHGFAKLCKGSGDEDAAVIFLKHNVIDEYDDQSDIAERLRIKTVPLFHFYKNGILLEAFPTRDKERIKTAIEKYTTAPAATRKA